MGNGNSQTQNPPASDAPDEAVLCTQLHERVRDLWLTGKCKNAKGAEVSMQSATYEKIQKIIEVDFTEEAEEVKMQMLQRFDELASRAPVQYLKELQDDEYMTKLKRNILPLLFTLVEEISEFLTDDILKLKFHNVEKNADCVVVTWGLSLFFYVFIVYCVRCKKRGTRLHEHLAGVCIEFEDFGFHFEGEHAVKHRKIMDIIKVSHHPYFMQVPPADYLTTGYTVGQLLPFWIADQRLFQQDYDYVLKSKTNFESKRRQII